MYYIDPIILPFLYWKYDWKVMIDLKIIIKKNKIGYNFKAVLRFKLAF